MTDPVSLGTDTDCVAETVGVSVGVTEVNTELAELTPSAIEEATDCADDSADVIEERSSLAAVDAIDCNELATDNTDDASEAALEMKELASLTAELGGTVEVGPWVTDGDSVAAVVSGAVVAGAVVAGALVAGAVVAGAVDSGAVVAGAVVAVSEGVRLRPTVMLKLAPVSVAEGAVLLTLAASVLLTLAACVTLAAVDAGVLEGLTESTFADVVCVISEAAFDSAWVALDSRSEITLEVVGVDASVVELTKGWSTCLFTTLGK